MQQKVDMIPLMMEKGYQARGWLGLILGTRLWYAFYGSEDEDEASFDRRVDAVVREIGDRGKLVVGAPNSSAVVVHNGAAYVLDLGP